MNHTTHPLLGCLAAVLLSTAAVAQSVPTEMAFTARVDVAGVPLAGTHSLNFTLFDAPTSGSSVWTELHGALVATNGLVYATLGLQTPLTPGILTGAPLFMEITVDGQVLTPRLPVKSVPYAVRSGVTGRLGTLTETDVQRRVTGTCATGSAIRTVNPDGTVVCEAGSAGGITGITTGVGSGLQGGASSGVANLALTTCATGQVLKFLSGGWACQGDADTTYGAAPNQGLSLSGTSFGLATCAAGLVLKSNGSSWSCQADADTTYGVAPNQGLSQSGTSFGLATCAAGQVLKSNGSSWSCQADANTTYTGLSPIVVSGTAVSLSTAGCVNGDVWRFAAGSWTCAAPYTDAQAVAAVGGQTVTRNMTFGPVDFVMAKLDGTLLSCTLPSTNCFLPQGTTTTLYVNMHIPAPATVTSVECLVLDNDTTGDIRLDVFNSSSQVGTAQTSGAVTNSRTVTVSGLNLGVSTGSRGPAFRVVATSGASQPIMFIYQCYATYTTSAL